MRTTDQQQQHHQQQSYQVQQEEQQQQPHTITSTPMFEAKTTPTSQFFKHCPSTTLCQNEYSQQNMNLNMNDTNASNTSFWQHPQPSWITTPTSFDSTSTGNEQQQDYRYAQQTQQQQRPQYTISANETYQQNWTTKEDNETGNNTNSALAQFSSQSQMQWQSQSQSQPQSIHPSPDGVEFMNHPQPRDMGGGSGVVHSSLKTTSNTNKTIFDTAATRWLNVTELIALLSIETTPLPISESPPTSAPPSGALMLYDRSQTRNYKYDKHEWIKKKNSNKIREDHVKLRVGGVYRVAGTYVHHISNPTFHRRSYHLLNLSDHQHPSLCGSGRSGHNLVLVHYLDTHHAAIAKPHHDPTTSSTSNNFATSSPVGALDHNSTFVETAQSIQDKLASSLFSTAPDGTMIMSPMWQKQQQQQLKAAAVASRSSNSSNKVASKQKKDEKKHPKQQQPSPQSNRRRMASSSTKSNNSSPSNHSKSSSSAKSTTATTSSAPALSAAQRAMQQRERQAKLAVSIAAELQKHQQGQKQPQQQQKDTKLPAGANMIDINLRDYLANNGLRLPTSALMTKPSPSQEEEEEEDQEEKLDQKMSGQEEFMKQENNKFAASAASGSSGSKKTNHEWSTRTSADKNATEHDDELFNPKNYEVFDDDEYVDEDDDVMNDNDAAGGEFFVDDDDWSALLKDDDNDKQRMINSMSAKGNKKVMANPSMTLSPSLAKGRIRKDLVTSKPSLIFHGEANQTKSFNGSNRSGGDTTIAKKVVKKKKPSTSKLSLDSNTMNILWNMVVEEEEEEEDEEDNKHNEGQQEAYDNTGQDNRHHQGGNSMDFSAQLDPNAEAAVAAAFDDYWNPQMEEELASEMEQAMAEQAFLNAQYSFKSSCGPDDNNNDSDEYARKDSTMMEVPSSYDYNNEEQQERQTFSFHACSSNSSSRTYAAAHHHHSNSGGGNTISAKGAFGGRGKLLSMQAAKLQAEQQQQQQQEMEQQKQQGMNPPLPALIDFTPESCDIKDSSTSTGAEEEQDNTIKVVVSVESALPEAELSSGVDMAVVGDNTSSSPWVLRAAFFQVDWPSKDNNVVAMRNCILSSPLTSLTPLSYKCQVHYDNEGNKDEVEMTSINNSSSGCSREHHILIVAIRSSSSSSTNGDQAAAPLIRQKIATALQDAYTSSFTTAANDNRRNHPMFTNPTIIDENIQILTQPSWSAFRFVVSSNAELRRSSWEQTPTKHDTTSTMSSAITSSGVLQRRHTSGASSRPTSSGSSRPISSGSAEESDDMVGGRKRFNREESHSFNFDAQDKKSKQ